MSTTPQHAISLEALLEMERRIEIINGEVVEMTGGGGVDGAVAFNLVMVLGAYVIEHNIGLLYPDGMTYLMYSEAPYLRDSFMPDLSFIQRENILPNWDISKPYPGVPDLAVEVISPNDRADMIEAKIQIYLQKGTQEIWVIYPSMRQVYQHTQDSVRHYRSDQDIIDTQRFFPNLVPLTLSRIFHVPAWLPPKP